VTAPRSAIPTWFFAVVVVRKGDRFLLVHERKRGQLWHLPGHPRSSRRPAPRRALPVAERIDARPRHLHGVDGGGAIHPLSAIAFESEPLTKQ